jgi:hypothetical protein
VGIESKAKKGKKGKRVKPKQFNPLSVVIPSKKSKVLLPRCYIAAVVYKYDVAFSLIP